MAKVRGTRFAYQTLANAGASEVTISNALRDVIPDKSFKLHGYELYLSALATSMQEVQILKNIGSPPGPTDGATPIVTHGVIMETVIYGVLKYNMKNMYTEPIDFDKDDSLNIRLVWGAQGAAEKAGYELILLWSEGK